MPYIVFSPKPGRAFELVEVPGSRPIASGSFEAVSAAARLLGIDWRGAYLSEDVARDICEIEDARILSEMTRRFNQPW
jgi:hypothetical protein